MESIFLVSFCQDAVFAALQLISVYSETAINLSNYFDDIMKKTLMSRTQFSYNFLFVYLINC